MGRRRSWIIASGAPGAATRDMYLDAKGKIIPRMSMVGSKATGVPGTVAGLAYAEAHFGKLGLARVMQPAIRLARDGYVLDPAIAQAMHSPILAGSPASKTIFQRDGNFYAAGDTFKQPELAKTLERIAADPQTFYKGAMASEIAAFEQKSGGLITAADLAAYEVKQREPLVGALSRAGGADLAAAELGWDCADRAAEYFERV